MLKQSEIQLKSLKNEILHVLQKYFSVFFLVAGMSVSAQNLPNQLDNVNRKRTAPDNCLVTAKVVCVTPSWKKISKKTCQALPCIVKLRIIKVKAYGSAFPVKLHQGSKIKTVFVYSAKAFDNGKIKLPGLKRGDVFDAEVIAKHKMNSNEPVFMISTYQKRQ
jgi:hypothetical protein